MMNTSCHGDNWTTVGCCYGNDNGSSCDRTTLQAEANAIYAEWIGNLIKCLTLTQGPCCRTN